MKYWVFTVGLKDQAPPVDWLAHWPWHLDESWFPTTKRPVAVSAGDRAVVYGSQGRGFIAAVEVRSSEPEPNGDARFTWKLKHLLLMSKAADGNVALPEAAGISSKRVVRGPHTEISEDEYRRSVKVMLDAAAGTTG